MKKVLVVVDMQNDFIDGSLGTKDAQAIVPEVAKKIEDYIYDEESLIITTFDTHDSRYLETSEGRYLPVEHCIKGSEGWRLNHQIEQLVEAIKRRPDKYRSVEKETFGDITLNELLYDHVRTFWADDMESFEPNMEIELVGLCTGICVVSNAILLKASFPEARIIVDSKCCACVTPESHEAALLTMKMCQIDVM